jgi:hypothetical protein
MDVSTIRRKIGLAFGAFVFSGRMYSMVEKSGRSSKGFEVSVIA